MAPRPNTSDEMNMNRKRVLVSSDLWKPNKKFSKEKQITTTLTKRITKSPENGKFTLRKMNNIFSAVEKGNLESVKELIQTTGPAIKQEKTQRTLLHVAAANNQAEVTEFLLKLIDPNVVDIENQTPAHLAAVQGHTEILKVLLEDDEMDSDKKDKNQRTFKDLLAVPLFKAVLHWHKKQIEELLKFGANPDYHAGMLVNGTLSRELGVTTPRQLAVALGRHAIAAMFPENRIPEINGHEYATSINTHSISSTDPKIGPMRLTVKPTLHPISGPDIYDTTSNKRGYVCILNYSAFENRPDLNLEASEDDSQNLASVFHKMGYEEDVYTYLSLEETKNVLMSVRDMDVLNEVSCAIFYISSHGCGDNSFLTSDMKHLTTDWVLDLFKDSNCPQLKNKPKLFIFDFCRGYYIPGDSDHKSVTHSLRVQEPLQDMMCLYSSSSSSGFSSYNFSKDGSSFTTALCRTLAHHSHDKEIYELYRKLLVEYKKSSPFVIPQFSNVGFTKKFYFNPVSSMSK